MQSVNVAFFIFILGVSAMSWSVDEPLTNADTATADTALAQSSEPASDSLPADTSTELPAIPRVQPQPAQGRIQDVLRFLKNYQRDNEVIKFGDEEATISGLYLPENTGKPQGGILILHDISQHAQWPQTVGPLREYLPDYGWNTLSLFFGSYLAKPLPVIPVQPAVTTEGDIATTTEQDTIASEEPAADQIDNEIAEENLPAQENIQDENFSEDTAALGTDALGDLAQNLQAQQQTTSEELAVEEPVMENPEAVFLNSMFERVEGGLRQLNTLGQFNLVVVAHGLSANWAAQTLLNRFNENPQAKGYALIIIDAKQLDYPSYPLNDSLAKLKIPMLDIVTQHQPEFARLSTARRNAIVREQNTDYLQITLPAVTSNLLGKENLVTRRVRGWLKTHAAGEEIDVKVRS